MAERPRAPSIGRISADPVGKDITMQLARALSIAFGTLVLLGGCGAGDKAERTLTVSGPPDAVAQFIGDQREREPALQSFAIESRPGGDAQGRLALPPDYDGGDIREMTQAALAAGLSYEIEGVSAR